MSYAQEVVSGVRKRDAHEAEFLQAVEEVLAAVAPVVERSPHYRRPAFLNVWSNPNG
jgi:glutamate dehydrogenase (NADP+)